MHSSFDSKNTVTSEILKGITSSTIYELAKRTPLEAAPIISRYLNNKVFFKREDLQPVFSFKLRGAFHKIKLLSREQKKKGVIAASAGNHAQGVAMGAQKLGILSVIVMPVTTPEIKVEAVKTLGAKVILYGDNYDDALEHSLKLKEEKGYAFIHPFDDLEVIAGQGTIGKEIIDEMGSSIDAIFVAVGGGGLLAGILTYVKEYHPNIKVIGVESEESACLKAAIDAGERITLDTVGIFADGVAVKKVGKIPFELINKKVDEVITVSVDEICAAIKTIYQENRTIQEPAGALGVAGMKKYVASKQLRGKRFVVVNCGANMNFDRLQHVAERTEIGANREMLLSVQIPETPGSFLKFCQLLGNVMITEFNYRYSDPKRAQVFVGIRWQESLDRDLLIEKLTNNGYLVDNISNNDVAKLHVRHMVGGKLLTTVKNEKIYRFQFPERPRALLDFLTQMNPSWDISLFHYRNHGSAYGRVLLGILVSKQEEDLFKKFLETMAYDYFDETDNIVCKRFLKNG